MALSDQTVVGLGDQLIGLTGSRMIDRIGRIERALIFLVGASADAECAHPGLHDVIRYVHSDARGLRRSIEEGFGVADSDPRDP